MTWIGATGWPTLLVWLAIGWQAQGVGAAPETELTAAEYVGQSDLIFVGRPIEKESFWSRDRRLILTRYTFSVVEPIKGLPTDLQILVEYGGSLNGLRLTVSHGVTYETGAEYLIFAEAAENGSLRTLGGQLGKLPVVTDAGGEKHVLLNPKHPLWNLGEARALRGIRALRTAIEALEGGAGR